MYVDNLSKTHDLRFMVVFLVMVVGALGAVYAVGYLAAGDKVPAHTTVAGVDVGSMSRHEARAVLVRSLDGQLNQPITVSVGGESVKIRPSDAGLTFDVDLTLDDAMGGTDWNPAHMLKVLEGGDGVDPVYRADVDKLEAALAPLAKSVERSPVDATVGISGTRPTMNPGHAGRRLDIGGAAEAFVTALRDHRGSVRLPLTSVPPKVGQVAAQTFMSQTLGPALDHSAVVAVGDHSVTVSRRQFAPALRVTETNGHFELGMVPMVLYRETKSQLASVPGRPVDATVVFKDGTPSVVPGRRGTHVTAEAWSDAVFAAVKSRSHHATAEVTTVDPDVTTADAKSYGITTKASEASGAAAARSAGALALAAGRLDGTVVLPGRSFSYVHEVGEASASTVLGPLGSATQQAAESAGMTITRYPLISPVGHDLGFRNSTNHPVYIHSWVAPHAGRTGVYVQFWGSAGV